MPNRTDPPRPDGWNPANEFDGHRTPEDHSGCTSVSVTLCADDWLIANSILDGYAARHPASDIGRSAGLIAHYFRQAVGV